MGSEKACDPKTWNINIFMWFFCQPIVKSPSESVQKKSMHSLVYFSCYGLGSEVQFLAFYLKKQPCSGSLKFPVLKISHFLKNYTKLMIFFPVCQFLFKFSFAHNLASTQIIQIGFSDHSISLILTLVSILTIILTDDYMHITLPPFQCPIVIVEFLFPLTIFI